MTMPRSREVQPASWSLGCDHLQYIKAFELGMADGQGAALPGVAVRRAECFRPGPGFEILARTPDRVRGIKHVIVAVRPLEQVKLDKTRHGMKMCIALAPAR